MEAMIELFIESVAIGLAVAFVVGNVLSWLWIKP